MLSGQIVNVVAEIVAILVLQGMYMSVCVISRSFTVYAYIQTCQDSILGVSGHVCIVE